MKARYWFTYEPNWTAAPMAFWVHVPSATGAGEFEPPAPPIIPHRGYCWLHFEFAECELVFSSPAQLEHLVDVLSKKPLPTSRQLSAARGTSAGPNGHWLSRLPATLKSPKNRAALVRQLQALQKQLHLARASVQSVDRPIPVQWPSVPGAAAQVHFLR